MKDHHAPVEFWLRQLIGETDVPARKIKASRYSVTGYVATTKAPRAQEAESTLEHDFLTLLEYDRRVERFLSQPFTIHWRDDRRHRYTPDVIVKHSYSATLDDPFLRTTIYEVKPTTVLIRDWSELKPKFRAAIGWAREHGGRFHIVTEREIRGDYLTNVRFLLGYRSRFLKDDSGRNGERQALIRETLYRLKRSTPRALLATITRDTTMQAELIPWIWNLINLQHIGVDLTVRLTMASQIWTLEDETTIKEIR